MGALQRPSTGKLAAGAEAGLRVGALQRAAEALGPGNGAPPSLALDQRASAALPSGGTRRERSQTRRLAFPTDMFARRTVTRNACSLQVLQEEGDRLYVCDEREREAGEAEWEKLPERRRKLRRKREKVRRARQERAAAAAVAAASAASAASAAAASGDTALAFSEIVSSDSEVEQDDSNYDDVKLAVLVATTRDGLDIMRAGTIYVPDGQDEDHNDHTCHYCNLGGEMICCDNCPRSFHETCLHENNKAVSRAPPATKPAVAMLLPCPSARAFAFSHVLSLCLVGCWLQENTAGNPYCCPMCRADPSFLKPTAAQLKA